MPRKPSRGRELNGILLLNKPTGISSNAALQKTLRLFKARKGGHTGSLDPLASGMLPICFGEATKISTYLLDAGKAYSVSVKLGITTDTGDADGEVVEQKPLTDFDRIKLESVLTQFRGEIDQVPPMYSALKHQGQRLYKLARRGESIERKPRRVSITRLELTRCEEDTFSLYVECTKGTYIRSLAVDIGEALGCGAHVTRLHRDWVAPFQAQPMYAFEQFESDSDNAVELLDRLLLPLDAGLQLPVIALSQDNANRLLMGQVVSDDTAQVPDSLFTVYGEDNRFLGIGVCKLPGRLAPKRLVRTFFDRPHT